MATNKSTFAYKISVQFTRDKAADFGIPVGSNLTDSDLQKAYNSKIFQDWRKNMQDSNEFDVQRIELQSLDYFGSHVGFLKMKADAKRNGIPVPGIVFLRGGSVAILTIIINRGKEYTVLTTQARVPIGCIFTEIPAGMLDENGNFKGVAANEMREETGIEISDSKLIDLTQLAFNNKFPGVYPSPGGCDEFIRLYVYREEVTDEKLAEFNGKCTGNLEENEAITLKVIPLDQLWKETPDVKALSCLYLYHQLKFQGRILPINSKATTVTRPPLEINTKIDSPSTLPAIGNKDIQISILDCEILKGMDTTLFIIETVFNGARKVVVRRVADFRVLDIELKNTFPNQKLQDFSLKADSPKPGKNIVQKKGLQDYLQSLIQAVPNVLNNPRFTEFLGFTDK